MNQYPIVIKTTFAEGTPFGLRCAHIGGKMTRAFTAPRTSFKALLKQKELKGRGVYILINRDKGNNLPQIIIGESNNLASRLPQYKKKEAWTEIVVFVIAEYHFSSDSCVRYIKSRLKMRVQKDRANDLQNKKKPATEHISEANSYLMDDIVENIVFLLSDMGFHFIR